MRSKNEITDLLRDWSQGDRLAGDYFFEVVYPELRQLAYQQLAREPVRISIQATDLVHTAYLKLADQRREWASRTQFFAIAATLMRRILVDHAKHRMRLKRGQGAVHLSIDEALIPGQTQDLDLLALDEALVELANIRMTAARIVELRYFAGQSVDETSAILGLSRATVLRKWRFARAWLAKKLGKE